MRLCFFITLAISAFADDAAPRRVSTVKVDRSSGRLVRSVVLSPKVVQPVLVKNATPAASEELAPLGPDPSINEIVEHTAKRYEVDPLLVHSVIQVESAYNKYAVSHAGAQGLMQIIPSTARRLGVKNVFDPKENIEAGVKYLKSLQLLFKDDRLALAAYNAGEGAVAKYGWIPPYSETQQYVYKVGKKYGEARRAAEQRQPPVAKIPDPPRIQEFVDSEGRLHLRSQ